MKTPVSKIKKIIPRLAITMGDPGGIGPEIVLKALADPRVTESCDLTIVGSRQILQETYQQLALEKLVNWENLKILDVEFDGKLEDICPGKGNAVSGDASVKSSIFADNISRLFK